ncbi:Hypothetical protein PHPALM_19386 [Phytophthora palmivora]|uniref:ER membrane protein complex subunit 4 n=1 Tax=Phytophthora palmivora TaxID=4796 RepID=A0A2P4XHH4_9STRA|nr:Hypothetical protein PHPALM_19386 [Phytophthora palmivora]
MEQRKWCMQLNEGRESDLPHRLAPVGYVKGVSADKDSNGAVAKAATNTSELKKKSLFNMNNGTSWLLLLQLIHDVTSLECATAFASVNDGVIDLTQPKAVYMAGSLVGAAMGVYKCSNMGLLPTTSADWTWLLPIKQAVETSSFAHSLGQ